MRKTFLSTLFLLLGLLFGAWLAMRSLKAMGDDPENQFRNGQWNYNPIMNLASDRRQRASIARIGLFALRESEVLYYLTDKDESGDPLDSDFDYELVGENLDSRYWSITLYDEDHFLIPNTAGRFSYNLDDIIYEDSTRQRFRLTISRQPREMNWLPAGKGKNMSVILRLYNPDKDVYENMAGVELPVIRKIGE